MIAARFMQIALSTFVHGGGEIRLKRSGTALVEVRTVEPKRRVWDVLAGRD